MTERPRVAAVVQQLPVSTPFLLYKFKELRKRGWPVEMVCIDRGRGEARELVALGKEDSRHVHYGWPTRSHAIAAMLAPVAFATCAFRNPRGTWRYLRGALRRFSCDALRRFYLDAPIIAVAPDVVHFEFGPLAVDRMHLRDLLGCAIVVSFRGYDLHYVARDRAGYYDDVWAHADAVHALGEHLWQAARTRGCPEDKVHALIAPAVDTEFFRFDGRRSVEPLGTPERPLRILSVGRVAAKKGHEYSLQAVALLRQRRICCELRIAGDGDHFEAVAFARHQLGLEDCVTLLGASTPDAVKMQMAWADVFLHSAVSEGFCNAVVEAQAMSLPVVCSDAGGLPENVADQETGFVTPRRRPEELAAKLELLARDGQLRLRLGAAARRRAVERFRIENQTSAFEDLYRRVATRSGDMSPVAEKSTLTPADAR